MHIIGASGHSRVIIDILLDKKAVVGNIWDDNINTEKFLHYKISGTIEDFKSRQEHEYLIAIGNNRIRKKIAKELPSTNVIFLSHKTSAISTRANIGNGTVVMAHATINIGVHVGEHVIINTNASIDHDCRIADFVHISPNVALAGNVIVGEGTHIGIGTSIIQGIKIGKWATIGAGTVIIRDVPDYAVVVGNPGKIIKYNY